MMKKELALSEDEHLRKIRSEGESYLQKALAPHVSGADRGLVVCAALRYLNERSRRTDSQSVSVASQAVVFSQATSQQTRESSFLSTLAASIDFDTQVEILVKVAVESANLRLLPVLTKCLSILAKKQSVSEKKDGNGKDEPVPSQAKKRKAKNQGAASSSKRKSKNKPDEDGMYEDVSLTAEMDDEADTDSASLIQGRTGQAFVDDFITKLVQVDAQAVSLNNRAGDVFLASVAREAPLSSSATKAVLISLLHRMRTVSLFELPAFVYQMLLFASAKGGLSLKKLFLVSLAQLFKEIEEKAVDTEKVTQSALNEDEDAITSGATTPKQIRQVQGTTLFHIEYALKQDPALVAELVKLAKSNVESQAQFLTPFGIAVLMAVARSPSFQTEVLGHIRDSLVRFEKERSIREKNLFAARVTLNDEELLRPSRSLLEAATRGGGDGWEFIAEPFFHFANMLLDRPVPGEKSLAIDLLRVLFCAQPSMRKPIMEQIVSRIALREKSAADAISVLSVLAMKVPLDVLELNYFIRQSIEDCVRLPPSLAALLISAIKPLLRSRRDLLDYFFLVMRKGLFHRESSNRAVAAYGFLTLLAFKTEPAKIINSKDVSAARKRSRRTSQSSALTDADLTRIKAATQPLRRAISHPPALRALLYKEVGNFLSGLSATPEREAACKSLKGLLRPHFLRYIDAANAPYILIDLCVDESAGGILHEPLGDLIQCLSVVESLLAEKEGEETYIVELARKLATVSLADFSISKNTSGYTGGTADEDADQEQRAEHAAALANRNRARVLGNVTEALISATLSALASSKDSKLLTDVVFPILELRGKVIEVLKHLGCATASDAIRDLGGDSSLEAGYALPFGLKRPGRPSANPKKPGKPGKNAKASGKTGGDIPSNTTSAADFRFGAFNILFSAAHSPTMPLLTAMQCLEKMSGGSAALRTDAISTFFAEKEEDRNAADLHSYLLAVAMKHIQNANDHGRKNSAPRSPSAQSQRSTISSAVCGMSRIAMRNFKRSKHRGVPQNSTDRLHSLQIVEACAKSISFVFENDFELFLQLASSVLPDRVADSDDENESAADFEGLGVLEELVENLIKDKAFKESSSLLRTYAYFTECMEQNYKDIDEVSSLRQRQTLWSRKILCKYATVDAAIVRNLTSMSTLYSENNDDLRTVAEVVERIHVVIGDCDASAEPPASSTTDKTSLASALSIQQTTSLAAVDSVLDTLDSAISDVEWCLSRMSTLEMSVAAAVDNGDHDSRGISHSFLQAEKTREKVAAQQTIRAEDAAQTRLEGVIRNLQALASCAVAKWSLQERLLRTTTRAYKLLSVATQAQIKRKGDPRTSFVSMLDACKGLAPILWTYLSFLGTEGGQDVSNKGGKVSKEARIMPQLIYEVELFEKLLISAQKHTRVNLLKGMRRNTARDFRIQEELLKEPQATAE